MHRTQRGDSEDMGQLEPDPSLTGSDQQEPVVGAAQAHLSRVSSPMIPVAI